METHGWRDNPFPEDLHALIHQILPAKSDTQFGDNWPTLWEHLALILTVIVADLRYRGPRCPIPPTYGGLCRMFSNTPKYIDGWITAIANTRATPPPPPAIPQNARSILSVPTKTRFEYYKLISQFVRQYAARQDAID
jgi:hypothetical protein